MALPKLFQFGIIAAILCSAPLARAEDPCRGPDQRALVFSGGGIKGAFEAGAAYHLIVQRECDFHDFSGISVGAINAAVLAQAAPADEREASHGALTLQTEALVGIWGSLKGSRDIVRPRRLGGLRLTLFGSENLNDFSPLRRLLEAKISTNKVAAGRPLRIGLTSFWDGSYGEVAIRQGKFSIARSRFLEYLYASSILPVVGRMPRFPAAGEEPDSPNTIQFGDASLRHILPVASYFNACVPVSGCGEAKPAHDSLQQLFVIATSPYSRGSYELPIPHAKYVKAGTKLVVDGRKVIGRAIALMADTPFRSDLDFLFLANDLLQWRANDDDSSRLPTNGFENVVLRTANAFPVESYNLDKFSADAHSRPYLIGLVKPEAETADIADLLSFSPKMIRAQLLSGCLAADATMQSDFGLGSMADACAKRFGNSRVQIAVAGSAK